MLSLSTGVHLLYSQVSPAHAVRASQRESYVSRASEGLSLSSRVRVKVWFSPIMKSMDLVQMRSGYRSQRARRKAGCHAVPYLALLAEMKKPCLCASVRDR